MSDLRLFAPIMKAEPQADGSLIVIGKATCEALDRQGEIMEYEGSERALGEWTGNIREMHDRTKAVGRRIEVIPDPENRCFYVKGRVSKGASDTQAKVLDGTLTHYSVGGACEPNGKVIVKVGQAEIQKYRIPAESVGRSIAIIKSWRMSELSLVDEGATPGTEIQIVKMIDGVPTIAKGALDDALAGVDVAPNEPPEEPADPLDDEKAVIAHLVEARRHLEAAAKLEVDEVQEHGTMNLIQLSACIDTIREMERTMFMTGAAEVISMSQETGDIRKGKVFYKLDGKELKTIRGMIGQLTEIAGAMEEFVTTHAMAESGSEKGEEPSKTPAEESGPEAETPPPDGAASQDPEEEKMRKASEAGKGELPPDGIPAKEDDEQKCGTPGMKKSQVSSGIQKQIGSDNILKSVEGKLTGIEKMIEGLAKRVEAVESEPVSGGPVRAYAVAKSLGGSSPAAPSGAGDMDALISRAFEEIKKSGSNRKPTEEEVRLAIAKQLVGEAPLIRR